ncbi:MAG: hypothetical protein M0Z77_10300 [Thermoplasmatales archaeon]|jgi:predicted type IV restriction endonuclease|nr:winged helix-turn-helix domain-containing protein [Candidatus Thermoplasmatota archaeon]MCL6003343.1 winged helix-turn-helix domain-containing protein [Candidatus Thermoplasmatota archaeon]MDA8056017.1 hypothetical protein [Thermoplasmatales archaeon]
MIDKGKIKLLVERGCGDKMDSEQTLRDSVIGGGLLEAMGWSFDKGEWTPNVAISFGTTTHHMDYWVGQEGAKWVLEAKNPINRLDRDKDVKELLSYMKQKDSEYGFLYNGKELLAFKLGSDLPFYEWSCGTDIRIFNMFSNNRFPAQLEEFIRSQGDLARFQNYVKQNTDKIKNQIIDLVADNSHTPKDIVDQYFPFLISLFSNETELHSSQIQESLETYEIDSPDKEVTRGTVQRVSRRMRLGPHLKESKAREIVLQILKDYNGKPLRRLEIVNEARKLITLTKIDKEILQKSKRPRWEAAVRWAVTTLNKDGLIRSIGPNQWVVARR